MERFEAAGRWWLPGSDAQYVTGTLRFEPEDRPTLEVVGTLRTGDFFSAGIQEFPIILGVAAGKRITLYQCYESKFQMRGLGDPASVYKAQYAFIGSHIESPDAVRFEEVAIGYSNLDHWARRSGLNLSHSLDKPIRIEIQYTQLEPLEFPLEDGWRVTVLSEFSTTGDLITSAGFNQRTLLGLKPPSPLPIREYLEGPCWHLQTLVSLGVSQPQFITCLKGTLPSAEEEPMEERRPDRFGVDVLFSQQQRREAGRPVPVEMLFSLGDLGDAAGVFVRNWISKGKELRPVYSLYFGTLFNSSMYVEHQFLSMIQAAESYQRRVIGGEYLATHSFEQVYKALVAAIPQTGNSAFETALKRRLRYHNRFALRKRLEGLLDRYGALAAPVLPGPRAFVARVVDTRNYLTHYDQDLKDTAATEPGEQFDLAQRLRVLLEVCFLCELGLSDEAVRKMIVKSRTYQYVLRMVDKLSG